MSQQRNTEIEKSIYNKLGKDDIAYFEKHGEMPAIKLTDEEMEYLKGGGLFATLSRIIRVFSGRPQL